MCKENLFSHQYQWRERYHKHHEASHCSFCTCECRNEGVATVKVAWFYNMIRARGTLLENQEILMAKTILANPCDSTIAGYVPDFLAHVVSPLLTSVIVIEGSIPMSAPKGEIYGRGIELQCKYVLYGTDEHHKSVSGNPSGS